LVFLIFENVYFFLKKKKGGNEILIDFETLIFIGLLSQSFCWIFSHWFLWWSKFFIDLKTQKMKRIYADRPVMDRAYVYKYLRKVKVSFQCFQCWINTPKILVLLSLIDLFSAGSISKCSSCVFIVCKHSE